MRAFEPKPEVDTFLKKPGGCKNPFDTRRLDPLSSISPGGGAMAIGVLRIS
jgi:hypothetical protein